MERAKYLHRKITGLQLAIALVWALHIFGLLGLFWLPMGEALRQITPFSSFIDLTPLNLILTAILLLIFHPNWNRGQIFWVVLAFAVGYSIEVAGVHTGVIFGEYSYGEVLGFKLLEVPLTIGINWMVLVYASGAVLVFWKGKLLVKALVMATLMTLLDFLIEPVAIYWGFWTWEEVDVPLQNYGAWWIIAFGLCWIWQKSFNGRLSPVAQHVWWAQVLFFMGNNLLIPS